MESAIFKKIISYHIASSTTLKYLFYYGEHDIKTQETDEMLIQTNNAFRFSTIS